MALTKADKEYLGAVLTPIAKDVKETKYTLSGNPNVAGDDGIEGMVKNNTRFRLNITRSVKYLWGLVLAVITKIVYGEVK